MSFTTVLDYLAAQLAADTRIASLFPGSAVTCVRRFKQRAEIVGADLPLIMITRPTATAKAETYIGGFKDHAVYLYCGFVSEDRDEAQNLLIQWEEAIDACIMKDPTLGSRVVFVDPGQCLSDEGKYHPVYFFVKELKISAEVTWQSP